MRSKLVGGFDAQDRSVGRSTSNGLASETHPLAPEETDLVGSRCQLTKRTRLRATPAAPEDGTPYNGCPMGNAGGTCRCRT